MVLHRQSPGTPRQRPVDPRDRPSARLRRTRTCAATIRDRRMGSLARAYALDMAIARGRHRLPDALASHQNGLQPKSATNGAPFLGTSQRVSRISRNAAPGNSLCRMRRIPDARCAHTRAAVCGVFQPIEYVCSSTKRRAQIHAFRDVTDSTNPAASQPPHWRSLRRLRPPQTDAVTCPRGPSFQASDGGAEGARGRRWLRTRTVSDRVPRT